MGWLVLGVAVLLEVAGTTETHTRLFVKVLTSRLRFLPTLD